MSESDRLPDCDPPEADSARLPSSSPNKISPTKSIAIPVRTTSLSRRRQTLLAPPSIPERTSSKRTASWDTKFVNQSTADLNSILDRTNKELSEARKKMKRQISMDEEYWEDYIRISQLHQDQAAARSQIGLRKFESGNPDKSWYDQEEAEKMKLQFDSWKQYESIMKKHTRRLQDRFNSTRENFVRLFATSKIGLNLSAGVGTRSSTDQSNFVTRMLAAYCPNQPAKNYRWDPILQRWKDSSIIHAAHLFPWRQVKLMDEIFGNGASSEIFLPINGLFLHKIIEKALDKGLIAIVPDVELDPANPRLPMEDQQERHDRVQKWEKQQVKDYKVIVVNKKDKEVNEVMFTLDDCGIRTLMDLHGRKLGFQTDFRPRARYIWWTFLNTILYTAWGQSFKDNNLQHEEVRKATRYWGTRGRYVKQNQLLGFVEELGQDVESILEHSMDEGEERKADGVQYDAVAAMVQEAIFKSSVSGKEDDESEEDESEEDESEEDESEEDESEVEDMY